MNTHGTWESTRSQTRSQRISVCLLVKSGNEKWNDSDKPIQLGWLFRGIPGFMSTFPIAPISCRDELIDPETGEKLKQMLRDLGADEPLAEETESPSGPRTATLCGFLLGKRKDHSGGTQRLFWTFWANSAPPEDQLRLPSLSPNLHICATYLPFSGPGMPPIVRCKCQRPELVSLSKTTGLRRHLCAVFLRGPLFQGSHPFRKFPTFNTPIYLRHQCL